MYRAYTPDRSSKWPSISRRRCRPFASHADPRGPKCCQHPVRGFAQAGPAVTRWSTHVRLVRNVPADGGDDGDVDEGQSRGSRRPSEEVVAVLGHRCAGALEFGVSCVGGGLSADGCHAPCSFSSAGSGLTSAEVLSAIESEGSRGANWTY